MPPQVAALYELGLRAAAQRTALCFCSPICRELSIVQRTCKGKIMKARVVYSVCVLFLARGVWIDEPCRRQTWPPSGVIENVQCLIHPKSEWAELSSDPCGHKETPSIDPNALFAHSETACVRASREPTADQELAR
jgi:hypothetical protein